MKEDFSELIEYLDERFTKIESQLESKSEKLDVEKYYNAVDAYSKRADDYFQEMVMLSHKVDRHEKWLHQVAEKLGVKLEY
jgi:uncharacterized coiled-coil DUF342 family protein